MPHSTFIIVNVLACLQPYPYLPLVPFQYHLAGWAEPGTIPIIISPLLRQLRQGRRLLRWNLRRYLEGVKKGISKLRMSTFLVAATLFCPTRCPVICCLAVVSKYFSFLVTSWMLLPAFLLSVHSALLFNSTPSPILRCCIFLFAIDLPCIIVHSALGLPSVTVHRTLPFLSLSPSLFARWKSLKFLH